MKKCSRCGQDFPAEAFGLKRNSLTIRSKRCDRCRSLAAVTWNERNPERMRAAMKRFVDAGKAREGRLRARYGISHADYEAMLEAQGGACAVCRGTEPGGNSPHLHVDHDHLTGEVRGLLCTNCNRAIGYLGDDPDRVDAAARYLRRLPSSE